MALDNVRAGEWFQKFTGNMAKRGQLALSGQELLDVVFETAEAVEKLMPNIEASMVEFGLDVSDEEDVNSMIYGVIAAVAAMTADRKLRGFDTTAAA